MRVFRLTRFAKVEVVTSAAFETNTSNRRLVAAITGDTVVHNHLAVGLSQLDQRMFRRVDIGSFALGAKIKVRTHRAVVSRPNDREFVATITSHIGVGIWALLWRLWLAWGFALKSKLERPKGERSKCGKRSEREPEGTQVELSAIQCIWK